MSDMSVQPGADEDRTVPEWLKEEVIQAMSETAPSWGHRVTRLLSIIGVDFGDAETTQWGILRDAHRTIAADDEAMAAAIEGRDWPPYPNRRASIKTKDT